MCNIFLMASDPRLEHLRRGPNEVFVLRGDYPHGRTTGLSRDAGRAWGLWALSRGTGMMRSADGSQRRLSAPALVCLGPGSGTAVAFPPAADVAFVAFTVRGEARRRRDEGWDAYVGEGPGQPTAQQWFGVGLPALVQSPQREIGIRIVRRVCVEWWRDDLRRLRAGAALGHWLYDWVIACRDRSAEDRWSRLARIARERLVKGFTTADLAEEVGCSRVHLHRRMVSEVGMTPGAWIDAIRREEADRWMAIPGVELARVARACGYASVRTFRRWYFRG